MDNFDELAKLRDKLLNLQETFSSETGEVDYEDILKEMDIDLEDIEQKMVESNGKLNLPYQILHPEAVHPKYNYGSDSGFDLHSVEDIVIPPFGRALVPSGLCFDIKDGFEIQVRTKSGLAINQGLMVLNSPGTVDCFSEDMKILTISGEKTINELNLNDVVFSFNEQTLEIEKDVIINIFNTEEQEIIIFETENAILEVTPNSVVYTKRGLILAKDIKENDEIIVFS